MLVLDEESYSDSRRAVGATGRSGIENPPGDPADFLAGSRLKGHILVVEVGFGARLAGTDLNLADGEEGVSDRVTLVLAGVLDHELAFRAHVGARG